MQKDTTRFASAISALSSRSGSPSKGGYVANGRRASRAAEDTAASGSRRGSEAGQAPVREGGAFAACCSMGLCCSNRQPPAQWSTSRCAPTSKARRHCPAPRRARACVCASAAAAARGDVGRAQDEDGRQGRRDLPRVSKAGRAAVRVARRPAEPVAPSWAHPAMAGCSRQGVGISTAAKRGAVPCGTWPLLSGLPRSRPSTQQLLRPTGTRILQARLHPCERV